MTITVDLTMHLLPIMILGTRRFTIIATIIYSNHIARIILAVIKFGGLPPNDVFAVSADLNLVVWTLVQHQHIYTQCPARGRNFGRF